MTSTLNLLCVPERLLDEIAADVIGKKTQYGSKDKSNHASVTLTRAPARRPVEGQRTYGSLWLRIV